MIGNGFIQNFSLSLEKDREVVVDGTIPKSGPQEPFTVVWVNTKLYNIQRKPDFKLNVSIDVKPSAGFKRKANPTEGGKWKIVICYWNMDNDGKAIINSSSF